MLQRAQARYTEAYRRYVCQQPSERRLLGRVCAMCEQLNALVRR